MRCDAEERKIAGFELALQCNHREGQCHRCWRRWMRVKGCTLRGHCGWIGGGWEEADTSNDSWVEVEMRYDYASRKGFRR